MGGIISHHHISLGVLSLLLLPALSHLATAMHPWEETSTSVDQPLHHSLNTSPGMLYFLIHTCQTLKDSTSDRIHLPLLISSISSSLQLMEWSQSCMSLLHQIKQNPLRVDGVIFHASGYRVPIHIDTQNPLLSVCI